MLASLTSRPIGRRAFLAAVVGAALTAGTAQHGVHAQFEDPSKTLFELAPRTDAGNWYGTWVYANRDTQVALWIRGEPDRPEVRMQFVHTPDAESFLTDWEGRASYTFRDRQGQASLRVTERDANTIRGVWSWETGDGRSSRTQTARIEMYRGADGRRLIMNFEDFELVVRGGGRERSIKTPMAWTFAKTSKRLLRWEELPF